MASTFTVLPEGLATRRTLKLASEKSVGLQLLPQVSDELPRVTTASEVVRVGEVSTVVVEVPPSEERATETVPAAVEPESSSLTEMPLIVFVPGIEKPKVP